MAEAFALLLKRSAIELSVDSLKKEERFLDELLRWNQRVNLTSIKDYHEALEKHLLDSLLLLKYMPETGRLLDMGSGGGLPGIPLAIACPGLTVVSIDSVGKKISFQKHIKRLLSLSNFYPRHQRLEEFGVEGVFDVVTARALSGLPALFAWAAPRQTAGGLLLVMKGPGGEKELEESRSAEQSPYRLTKVHRYQLPESRSERLLLSFIKT